MRAALYVRESVADVGRGGKEILAALREYVLRRGWEIAGEYLDRPRSLTGRRPALLQMVHAVRASQIQVVVTPAIARLFRSLRHIAELGGAMQDLGVEFVATQDDVDTTDPIGGLRWRDFVELLRSIDRAHRSEAAKLSRILAAARPEADNWGRPVAEVNPLEVLGLWHGSEKQRPLSQREIARKVNVGATTLRRHLRELQVEGRLDAALRASNLERHGGLRKGGRPAKGRTIDDQVLARLYNAGTALAKIASHFRTSRGTINKHLARLRQAGLLDEAARAKAKGAAR